MGIESMKQTLFSAQKSLDITGNNLANVNTVGYSRQRADQVSLSVKSNSLYFNTSRDIAGQGAKTSGIAQLRDPILDKRYRDLNSGTAVANVQADTLTDIQNVVDVIDTTGFYGIYSSFKSAMSQYSTDSTDRAELANVTMQYAKQMCQALKNYDTQLNQISDQITIDSQTSVDRVNAIFKEMGELNEQIKNSYVSSGDIIVDSSQGEGYKANSSYGPNELKDQFNALADELSTYGNLTSTEQPDGTFTVDFAGKTVVNGKNYTSVFMEIGQKNKLDPSGNPIQKTDTAGNPMVDDNGDPVYETENTTLAFYFKDGTRMLPSSTSLASGALRGYLDMYNGAGVYASELDAGQTPLMQEAVPYAEDTNGVAYYREMLNALANTMASNFNNACEAGDMFVSSDGMPQITASNISVSKEWSKDAQFISYGPTGATVAGEELDSTYLNRVKKVVDTELDFSRKTGGIIDQTDMTIDGYVSYWSNTLGQDISYANSVYDAYDSMALSLSNQRDEIMGVSMDEEGANLMVYQKWYNATARMMTALDEALDTIINGMGLVGR